MPAARASLEDSPTPSHTIGDAYHEAMTLHQLSLAGHQEGQPTAGGHAASCAGMRRPTPPDIELQRTPTARFAQLRENQGVCAPFSKRLLAERSLPDAQTPQSAGCHRMADAY